MERFILRAEIQTARDAIVSYGYDLGVSSVFVVTDWHEPVGTLVSVRLSLPAAFEPVELAARVSQHRAAGAPGELGGVLLAFEHGSVHLDELLGAIANRKPIETPYRVLLVEDSSLTRDVFEYSAGRYFGDDTVAIDHAESAERAWELLATQRYNIVIADYFLPSTNGASLIARLRADPRLRSIPVVAISVGGGAARDATLLAGADLFIDKPLVFKDLFNTLHVLAQITPPHDAGKRTILVLDDSALALAVTRAALESAGFTVVIAEDLGAFERQRATCDPDLILVDLQMPEAYGDDVAATLVGQKGVAVPVLLFSSVDEDELARRSSEAHVFGYIWKGAGMNELVRRCKEILELAA